MAVITTYLLCEILIVGRYCVVRVQLRSMCNYLAEQSRDARVSSSVVPHFKVLQQFASGVVAIAGMLVVSLRQLRTDRVCVELDAACCVALL